MDLAAEFYLQTVETVFVRHALPKGEMTHRGVRDRSGADPPRRAADDRRRERRHFRRRPDRGGAQPVRQHSGRAQGALSAARPSAITACSTARASAPRSRRASPTSCSRTTAISGVAAGKRAASGLRLWRRRSTVPCTSPPMAAGAAAEEGFGRLGQPVVATRLLNPFFDCKMRLSRILPAFLLRFVVRSSAQSCIRLDI